MRTSSCSLLAVAVLVTAGGWAFGADSVVLSGTAGSGPGGAFEATLTLEGGGVSVFDTFCIERWETFVPGTSYEVQYSTSAKNGGNNTGGQDADGGDPISAETAWLYREWRGPSHGGLAPLQNGQEASWGETTLMDKLQQQLWHLEDETTTATGNTIISAVPEIDSLLGGVTANELDAALATVRVMRLWDDAESLTGNHQDQLVIIPLPQSAGLAGMGLLALAGRRRTRA